MKKLYPVALLVTLISLFFSGCKGLEPPDDKSTINFGKVIIADKSEEVEAYWTNKSDNTIDISDYEIRGDQSSAFKIDKPIPVGLTAAPGIQTPRLGLLFAPNKKGTYEAFVFPVVTDKNAKVTPIRLIGEGVYQLSSGDFEVKDSSLAADSSLNFGKVYVDPNNSAERTISFFYKGNRTIRILAEFAGGNKFNAFSINPPLRTIDVRDSIRQTFIITFAPPDSGLYIDALVFKDADGPSLMGDPKIHIAGVTLVGKGIKE